MYFAEIFIYSDWNRNSLIHRMTVAFRRGNLFDLGY